MNGAGCHSSRFEKIYFPCTDKEVIRKNVRMCHGYSTYAEAKKRIPSFQKTDYYYYDDKTKPIDVHSVEAFYLVPEEHYYQIIEPNRQHVLWALYFHSVNGSVLILQGGSLCAAYWEKDSAEGWQKPDGPTTIQLYHFVPEHLYEEILLPHEIPVGK